MERKRSQYKQIPLSEKIKILRRLEAGEKGKTLAEQYHVSESAISHMKRHKTEILKKKQILDEALGENKQTRLSGVENSRLEKALFKWFCQKRTLGEPVSGPLLCEQALLFHAKLGENSLFTSSNGWLHRFKKRHGIRELSVQGEKLSGNTAASVTFCNELVQVIQEGGYALENVYNADETGLVWKSLPRRTLAARNETRAAGRKILKDRVTVMACANSTGTHKIPLLVIGKSKKPRCFKNINKLPVEYRGQPSAWIDREIFKDWFSTIFLHAVKNRENAENVKILLLLDNAPSHPPAEDLNAVDDCCRVIFLPPNVTALIQPMDQGVIEAMKKNYKKAFLRQLLLTNCQNDEGIANFVKTWTMLSCCQSIYQAWDNLTSSTLRNAWNNILGRDRTMYSTDDNATEIVGLINRVPGYGELQTEAAVAWLQEDADQPSSHTLSDDEILNQVDPFFHIVNNFEDQENQEQNDEECEEDPHEVTANEALTGLNTFQRWFQTRWESEPADFSLLNKMRELAENIILGL